MTVFGQVKLFALSPAGQEKIIEIVAPGGSFAEALMFTGSPYFINVQALSETVLLSVSKHSVLQEIERDPKFCMRMLAGLSRRLRGLVSDVQAYALHGRMWNGSSATSCATCPTAAKAAQWTILGSVLTLPVSKAAIASRLSMTPEYFSRVLHELEAKGLIVIDKRDIHIPDPKRLVGYPVP